MKLLNNNLFKRIISGIVYAGIIFLSAYFDYGRIFMCLIGFILTVELIVALIRSETNIKIQIGLIGMLCIFLFMHIKSQIIYAFIIFASIVDTSAYLCGRIFQGPKLTSISPNKTWSGAIGAIIVPFLVVVLIMVMKPAVFPENLRISIVFFVIMFLSIAAQAGDILVSYAKRKMLIKDAGIILPGHGGLWDRFDSVMGIILFCIILRFFCYVCSMKF
ncbi:phosphatidate cytidylyltransferase [Candidatus Cytomitobacter primus]|nr:phosphatidate cytidylyltransferase [Candidatus Cytomitobacter primus]